MTDALAVLGGYLLGSMPFGYWVPKLVRGEDIRTKGSGNVGASNVFRVYGRSLGVPVALLDLAKGFAAAALGLWAGGALIGVLAAAAAMVGHARPVFLRFEKGGKMVATAGGATLALAPLAAFICIAVWLVVFLATRYASLASLVTALALAILVVVLDYPWPIIAFGIAGAAAVIVLHRQNIRRLVGGTEHRFERQRASWLSQAASVVWCELGSPVASSPRSSPDRSVALGHDVVDVDRLEVDLPREQEVFVVELRQRVERVAQRMAHGVLDEAGLQVRVLDDEQLVRPLEQVVDRRAHRALGDVDEHLRVEILLGPDEQRLTAALVVGRDGNELEDLLDVVGLEPGLEESLRRHGCVRGPARTGTR